MSFIKTDSKLVQEKTSDKPVTVFGLFKDLNRPFESEHSSPFSQFSPIRGINKDLLKNLRLHGHYGPKDKGLPRPNWDGIDPHNYPQDWTASLLEFFAPSYIGFLFDSVPSTPFHKWFKFKNIALIFNAIIETSFYDDHGKAILKLASCLQPEDFKKRKVEDSKREKLNPKGFSAFTQLNSLSWPPENLPFAGILFNALNETKGDGAQKLGYPDHVVELILLTYMWERKRSKLDLKPFYDNLSESIIDKEEVKKIIWENEGSFYTEEDYFKVVSLYNDKQPMTLEEQTLLQLGYSYFEDRFPPIQSYGVSVFKIEEPKNNRKKSESFSDCGEISLLNYFMIALYDPNTKKFDWERLELLKKKGFNVSEKLIHFFRHIYVSPICDFTPEIRNAWAAVLSDLNAQSNEFLIHYLKDKCCIAPGLDNMDKVMKKLLQPPTKYNGDIFLELLNIKEDRRRWYRNKDEDVDKNITLTFSKYSDKDKLCEKIFQWYFQNIHFDFNRLGHAKYKPATQILEGLKASINENSHKKPDSDTLDIPELLGIDNETAFSKDLFQGDLESIEGKCYALYKIFWFKNKFKSSSFDYLIQRWLEPRGKYFAGWEDFYTNKTLLKILITDFKLPKVAIDEMNIPALSAHIRAKIVYRYINASETISSDNEDIIILGSVNGTVTNINGKIKIIGNIYENGHVKNIHGNNEINGDISGHLENFSGNNKITGTVSTKGNVKNSTGNNQISGDATGHIVNYSGDNKITGTVYTQGHIKNSAGNNEIGKDVLGHVLNFSGENKITGTLYKQEHVANPTVKKTFGVQRTFFSKSLNINENDLLIQHRTGTGFTT